MVNYTNTDVAEMRRRALQQLQADLQKSVTTKSGTFAVGRGASRGANIPFLEAVKKAGGISRAQMFQITGNVSREDQPVKNLISQLEQNKQAREGVKGVSSVEVTPLDTTKNVSYYEQIFGNPADLMPQPRQAVSNVVPPTLASPKIALSEMASAVSVPSENLVQIGQSVNSSVEPQEIPPSNQPQIAYQQSDIPTYEDVYLASGDTGSSGDESAYYDENDDNDTIF